MQGAAAAGAPAALQADPAVEALRARIVQARAARTPLEVRGSGSKAFYGEPPQGEPLDVRGITGISSHEPSELVVTVRAGTPLVQLEAALAAHGQCLAFEPPRFAGPDGEGGTGSGTVGGTVGGMVAAGLSGPARANAGSVRDFVLGATLLDGRGELLSFGGQVMKNVAGYDVSRLLAGSLGVLGVIVEVSLKVLPLPPATATLRFELAEPAALRLLAEWGGQPLPVSASAWWDGTLVLRLSGATAAVQAAQARLAQQGGEAIEPALAAAFWAGLRDQTDEFFAGAARAVDSGACLWRLSVPQTAPPLGLTGEQLVEWHGGQRWLCTTLAPEKVRAAAAAAGGHATLFRAPPALRRGVMAPLSPPLARIHRQLKAAFDPAGILNPGRLYPDL